MDEEKREGEKGGRGVEKEVGVRGRVQSAGGPVWLSHRERPWPYSQYEYCRDIQGP